LQPADHRSRPAVGGVVAALAGLPGAPYNAWYPPSRL